VLLQLLLMLYGFFFFGVAGRGGGTSDGERGTQNIYLIVLIYSSRTRLHKKGPTFFWMAFNTSRDTARAHDTVSLLINNLRPRSRLLRWRLSSAMAAGVLLCSSHCEETHSSPQEFFEDWSTERRHPHECAVVTAITQYTARTLVRHRNPRSF